MSDAALHRFLDLVKRELGAQDAYLQLGGEEPRGAQMLFHEVANATRVVVCFEQAPAQPSALHTRLAALATTFRATLEAAVDSASSPRTPADVARQRLDEELSALSERAGADRAFVFDFDSPVIWGTSRVNARSGSGVPANQLLEQAAAELRENHGDELRRAHGHTVRLTLASEQEALARPFASMYVLSLLFESPLSEPIALGAVLHAAGLIERLVLALPPVDPDPGAKVIRLSSRR